MDMQRLLDSLLQIPDLIREPSANIAAALLLLAIATTALLVAVVTALLYLLRGAKPEIEAQVVSLEHAGSQDAVSPPGETVTPTLRAGLGRWLRVGVYSLAVIFGLWVTLGVSSAERTACESCHPDTPHADAESIDAHAAVACTWCHEPGGVVDRALFNVLGRVAHAVDSQLSFPGSYPYGLPISSVECKRCHGDAIAGISVDDVRGVSMSHREPLDAGAECVDCHMLVSGVVTARTVGHDPCLRCHGKGTTSADCDTCHVKDTAYAIRAEPIAVGGRAREQVPDPTCGGCHSEASCDACHGIRMPHSTAFKAIGHARLATIDIWERGGATCRRCHYAGHKDCGRCHPSDFPAHAITWKTDHQQAADDRRSCSCHLTMNLVSDPHRTYCDICHDPAYQVVR